LGYATKHHIAFSKDRNLHFPLLSDFEPKGEIARKYGVYRNKDGVCERALFVIDKDGIIQWSYVSPIGVNPGAEGLLKALESLSSTSKQFEQKQSQQKEVEEIGGIREGERVKLT
jgi:peroxiredoxin